MFMRLEAENPNQIAHFQTSFPTLLRSIKLTESILDDAGGNYIFTTREGELFEINQEYLKGMKKMAFYMYLSLTRAGLEPMANIQIRENVVIFEHGRRA